MEITLRTEILERLEQLMAERGWSVYRLARECGLSESTVANIFRRNGSPSLETLQAMCRALEIPMSRFFAENEMVELTPELRELFEQWALLTKEQKNSILEVIRLLGQK